MLVSSVDTNIPVQLYMLVSSVVTSIPVKPHMPVSSVVTCMFLIPLPPVAISVTQHAMNEFNSFHLGSSEITSGVVIECGLQQGLSSEKPGRAPRTRPMLERGEGRDLRADSESTTVHSRKRIETSVVKPVGNTSGTQTQVISRISAKQRYLFVLPRRTESVGESR